MSTNSVTSPINQSFRSPGQGKGKFCGSTHLGPWRWKPMLWLNSWTCLTNISPKITHSVKSLTRVGFLRSSCHPRWHKILRPDRESLLQPPHFVAVSKTEILSTVQKSKNQFMTVTLNDSCHMINCMGTKSLSNKQHSLVWCKHPWLCEQIPFQEECQ